MRIESFAFTVDMLAELLGRNKQHLTRKIKQMAEDPEVLLKVKMHSRKEGYRIPAEEVIRCFNDEVTPQQVQSYVDSYSSFPNVSSGTSSDVQHHRLYEAENELLRAWRIQLASTSPSEQKSAKMRAYLEDQLQKIQQMRMEKIREQVMLEEILKNSIEAISELEKKLNECEDNSRL